MWRNLHIPSDGVGSTRDGVFTVFVDSDLGLAVSFVEPVGRRAAEFDGPATGTRY